MSHAAHDSLPAPRENRAARWVVLFVAALFAYSYFYQAGGWNQNSRFDLTRAIVERGTLRIDAFAANTGDKAKRGEHYYCDKAPGASLAAVPAWAAFRAVAPEPPSPRQLAWGAWLATVVSVGIPAAIAVVALYFLALAWGVQPRWAGAGAASYGLATHAFPYATLLYGHQIIAAYTIIAFATLAIPRARGVPASMPRLITVGALLGWAVVCEYPAALSAIAVSAYALACAPPKRAAIGIALGAVLPAAVLGVYHAGAFGSPWTLPYEFSTQPHRHQGFFMGLGVPSLPVLQAILLSGYRGLLWSAPWLLAGIAGGVAAWRRGFRSEVLTCGAIALLFLWLNASLVDWHGGWSIGPRYLVPMLPFVIVPMFALLPGAAARSGPLPRAPRWKWWAGRFAVAVTAVLVVRSASLMLVATAVKPEVPTEVRKPFADYLWPRWSRDEVASSTQSIDMPNQPERAPRQAWNLGHKLGLAGRASLIPFAALMLACAVAFVVLTRSRR